MTIETKTAAPAAATGPFSFTRHAEIILAVARTLSQHDLSCIQRCPTRFDLKALPYEPVNLWHALFGHGRYVFDRTCVPGLYRRLHGRRLPMLGDFVDGLITNRSLPAQVWHNLFGERLTGAWLSAELLVRDGAQYRSRLRMLPCDGRLLVADSADSQASQMVWLGKDSLLLLDAVRRRLAGMRFCRGLEVGCGSGILTLALADYCEGAVGIDINPRAVECGRLNAHLNGVANAEFRGSDLFRDVPEAFDVIVSNPPYIFVDPRQRAVNVHAHGGDDYGMDIELAIMGELHEKLTEHGVALLLCTSPVVNGVDALPQRVQQRLADRALEFEFEPLFNNVVVEHLDYHRASGIDYHWVYLVTVRRARRLGLRVRSASAYVRMKSWAFRSLVNASQPRWGGNGGATPSDL